MPGVEGPEGQLHSHDYRLDVVVERRDTRRPRHGVRPRRARGGAAAHRLDRAAARISRSSDPPTPRPSRSKCSPGGPTTSSPTRSATPALRPCRCACGRTRCRSVDTATSSADAAGRSTVLVVSLLTRGSPTQVTGGHLYHRRMAEAAAARGARDRVHLDRPAQSAVEDAHGVVLVDSLAAWSVAPWVAEPTHASPTDRRDPPPAPGRRRARCPPHRGAASGRPTAVPTLRSADRREHRTVARPRRHGTACPPSASASWNPAATCRSPRAPAGDLRAGRRIALLCVGNWLPNKGVIELLDAVAALPSDHVTLHLVGRTDVDVRYTARVLAPPRCSRPRRTCRRPRTG